MRGMLILAVAAGAIAWYLHKPSQVDQLATRPTAGIAPAESGVVDVDPGILPVAPDHFAVRGRHTVVIFGDARCPSCIKLDNDLRDFMRQRPDVAVRKVMINLNDLGQARRDYRWDIEGTPTVLVYDPQGKLLAGDVKLGQTGTDLLYDWINKEAVLAANQSN